MDGVGALGMGRGALVLSALTWFLICGFPSSFMAKFLSWDRVGFSDWLWEGDFSLGTVLSFPLIP